MKTKLLAQATDQQVIDAAHLIGYTFDAEDVAALRAESYPDETLYHAINDYLDAYER